MRQITALIAFLSSLLLWPARGQESASAAGGTASAAPRVAAGQTAPGQRGGGPGRGTQGVLGGVGGPEAQGPAAPAPRRADGTIMIGSPSTTDKGVWLPGRGGFTTITAEDAVLPFQPWAQAVLEDRLRNQLEPHTRCKPSGVSRQFLTPYGVEILDLPELQRIYIFDIGGPHTYRTIYMDGRSHPADLTPSFYGHSIGWWEGDTLVVDTVGFNEAFWIDRRGTPHTGELHTIERFTRTDARTMAYELTIDDPGAYTAAWTAGFTFGWENGTELFEYVCQQANYADNLMVGEMESVNRTSPIVP